MSRNPTVALGVLLILIGIALLLDRLDVLDAGRLAADWWPLVVVGLGAWWMLTARRLAGLLAIGLGALLLAGIHDVVQVGVGNLILPAILVTAGAAGLAAGARLRAAVDRPAPSGRHHQWGASPIATAVFGDARVSIADDGGERAAVTAVSVFGDVEVSVPAGWRVVDRTSALFGTATIPTDQPTYAESPVIELHGLAMFGDIKVRYLDDQDGA